MGNEKWGKSRVMVTDRRKVFSNVAVEAYILCTDSSHQMRDCGAESAVCRTIGSHSSVLG
jgi:hypothetical protein